MESLKCAFLSRLGALFNVFVSRIQFLVMELDDVMLQSLTASTTKRCFELKHGSTKLVENVSAKDIAPRRYIFLSLVLYISFQLEDLRLINISNTAPTSNSASVCLQLGSVLLRIVEQKS
ncbi:hypothetical protein O6H91_23G067400 [Diphasiastrum complanatum]|uniref:Uncharacterized protein n=1 Tax=Diphasiastrum complanatum TaxID=34168 RepID=A0ACC2ABR3_DIPCM|nr:hypothetical protein O6H91_23G067400 [Diphasiastrum complanatum]